MRLLAAALSVALAAVSGCTQPPAPEADVAIEGITVVDAVSGARPGMRVLISNGRISALEPAGSAPASASEIVDGEGAYLIPGLWDMHVHFLYDESLTALMADLFLRYGITSVRDTGGDVARMQAIAGELESRPTAPRLHYAGPLLDGRFVVYDGADPGRPALGTRAGPPEAARRQLARLKAAGADHIKIYELVSPEQFEALAAAAREAGMPIASHVPLTTTADRAGPLADSMEHLRNLELACAGNWEELLSARLARINGFTEGRGYDLRRELHSSQRLPAIEAYDEARCDEVLRTLTATVQVPTLRLNTVGFTLPFLRDDWQAALAALPEATRETWSSRAAELAQAAQLADHRFAEWSLFLISRLRENGVPVGAGTDTPIGLAIPGYSLHTELELLVQAGLSEQEALAAATTVPAAWFSLEDELGRIEPGQRADLVLLDGNPLEDIGNTRRVRAVMVDGQWHRAQEHTP